MKHSLPSLDSLKAFESAARHLSFSLAANELCITKGAISYQIRKLEEELQCELFKRSIRQVYLTEAGQYLFKDTQMLFKEFKLTFSRLKDVKKNNSVTIAATTYVAARWLSSRISQFNELFPEINIVLQHSVNTEGYKLEEADLTIIWGPYIGKYDNTRLAEIPMEMFPVMSPKLLDSLNLNTTTNLNITEILNRSFSAIPLLCEDREFDTWQEWFENHYINSDTKLVNPRRIISDANVRVQAAIDGQGLILADDLMRSEIDNGLLVRPFKESLKGYGYAFFASSSKRYADNAQILKEWCINKVINYS